MQTKAYRTLSDRIQQVYTVQTSERRTASSSDFSGSRAGTNSWAYQPVKPMSATAFAITRQFSRTHLIHGAIQARPADDCKLAALRELRRASAPPMLGP